MTPYEAWHGSKPVASNLRVFGCDAYAYILLGYGQETKGYRLYDTAQSKVIHSRDVKFNEDVKESDHSTLDVENDGDYRLVLDFTDDETGSQPDTPTEAEAPEVQGQPDRNVHLNITGEKNATFCKHPQPSKRQHLTWRVQGRKVPWTPK